MCDCSSQTGRALDLCTGKGHDNRPDPRPEAVDLWRSTHCTKNPPPVKCNGCKSRGFGDTVAKITHAVGLDKVAESVAKAVGAKGCGCGRRQEFLNKVFPYGSGTIDNQESSELI